MIKPNFFIVGAPRCGTTAISVYLREHPNIFIPKDKEPHYFAEDFPKYGGRYRVEKSPDNYLKLFEGCTSEHLAVGEVSVWYLYSSVAIKNIYEFSKNAKIIVMLRNPVDLVYSIHSKFAENLNEAEDEFETAWRLQSSRKRGLNIPETCMEPALLQYSEVGKLSNQLERVLKIFPSEQVKVILFDDFKKSNKAVYEDILSFLEVPSDGRHDFPKINESAVTRLRWLNYFTRNPLWLSFCRYLTSNLKKLFGLKQEDKLGIMPKIHRLNTRKTSRKPLNPDLRAELVNEFREDIEKLSRIIDRDLSHWSR